jgi:hypothetical protein
MRNILEYPITYNEIVIALHAAMQSHREAFTGVVGNIDMLALHKLEAYVRDHRTEIEAHLSIEIETEKEL